MSYNTFLYSTAFLAFQIYAVNLYAASFETAANISYFNYEEFNKIGQSLDKETGILPGITLKYSQQYNSSTFLFYTSYNSAKIDYTGATQSGQPHKTKTEEQLLQLGFKFITKELSFIPAQFILGLRHWSWDRNILANNNVRGLHETYTWSEISLGLNFKTEIQNDSFYWANISALYTLNPEIEIFLATTKETLSLSQKPGFRFKFGKTWINTVNSSYNLSITTEYWQFGRSNTIFTDDLFGNSAFITEPDSETLNIGLEFSYSYHF